jgi:hypothetical protein
MKNEKTPKALVESLVKEAFEQEVLITESVKEGVKYKLGSKEMDFGSADHVRVLKGMLHGLQGLRDCYQVGSANRHVYSAACHKLRKLIAKHSQIA